MKAKKKFVAIAMATAMLSSTVTVNAQTANISGNTGSGSSPSEFNVTAEMLGGDLVVTVPDAMTLEYSQVNSNFSKTAQVNAKGNINPAKKLEVTVPTAITYTHEDDSNVTADGTITFGVTDGANQKETWSAEALKNASSSGVDKDITSTVPLSEVEYTGNYTSTINFSINLVDAN